jgi:hypothetical protein
MVTCPKCSSSTFRLSRFREQDFARLFLLQYPVRCLDCHGRRYTWLPALVPLLANRRRGQPS